MKHKALRTFIKSKDLEESYSLKSCNVVIDGDCYFRGSYKASGCQSLFGPECDSYAQYLIKTLTNFNTCGIECHVIFKGEANINLEKMKDNQQTVISTRAVESTEQINTNFDPMFVKQVQLQVLQQMNIKYFICEFNSLEAIISAAMKFRCPVLTDNIEYSLLGASCVPINSLTYVNCTQEIHCSIYNSEKIRAAMGLYKMAPTLLLTVLNESGDYYHKIPKLLQFDRGHLELEAIRWVKRHKQEDIAKIADNFYGNERKTFLNTYEKLQNVVLYPSCHLAAKYFKRDKSYAMFKDDKKWFSKGVANGRIAVPFVNLKINGILRGSRYINDKNKPDAMLAALDIITYSHCLLTNSEKTNFTFVGRKYDNASVWEIAGHNYKGMSNRGIFNFSKTRLIASTDHFNEFLNAVLPGLVSYHLLSVPLRCRIVILSLVYYVHKVNKDFEKSAYCVLLCYFALGTVATKLQHKNLLVNAQYYGEAYKKLKFLFEPIDEKKFQVDVVHQLTEFQHCLEFMNYLNKTCGEKGMPCTVYHEAYNATFVYNALLYVKDKDSVKHHLMSLLRGLNSEVVSVYQSIVEGFEGSLQAVRGKPMKSDLEKVLDKTQFNLK